MSDTEDQTGRIDRFVAATPHADMPATGLWRVIKLIPIIGTLVSCLYRIAHAQSRGVVLWEIGCAGLTNLRLLVFVGTPILLFAVVTFVTSWDVGAVARVASTWADAGFMQVSVPDFLTVLLGLILLPILVSELLDAVYVVAGTAAHARGRASFLRNSNMSGHPAQGDNVFTPKR